MQRITMRTTLLLALVLGTTGCFPTFPDEGALKNLRTVAIQQEPAVLVLDGSCWTVSYTHLTLPTILRV